MPATTTNPGFSGPTQIPTAGTTLREFWKKKGLPVFYEVEDFFGTRWDLYEGEPFGGNRIIEEYTYRYKEAYGIVITVKLRNEEYA